MGLYETEFMNSIMSNYGRAHDLFQLRDTSIKITTDSNQVPDLDLSLAESELERVFRLCLSLDHGYVTMVSHDPRMSGRPVPFVKETELRPSPALPEETNMSYLGSVGKLSDAFHISVSEGEIIDPAATKGDGTPLAIKSFGDRFGESPDPSGEESVRPKLLFGRMELRIGVHFYADDRLSGPLLFTRNKWPLDIDTKSIPTVETPRRPVKDETTFDKTIELRPELLVGDVRMSPDLRAFGPVVTIQPQRCLPLLPVVDEGAREKCDGIADPAGTKKKRDCFTDCVFIECDELAEKSTNERILMISDRINCIMESLDTLFCHIAHIELCLGDAGITCDLCKPKAGP